MPLKGDALKREVYEETCVKLKNIRAFGYFKVVLSEFNPAILNYPYPESYLLLYNSNIDSLDPFVAEYETQARKLFPPEEAKNLFWVKRYRTIYDAVFNETVNISSR